MNTSAISQQGNSRLMASTLGVMAIVLGVFLSAFHANEWMKQMVMSGAMPEDGQLLTADCPPAELAEEGISVAECEFMVDYVVGLNLSMPEWFPEAQASLAFVGALLAFGSILAGAILVNGNPAGPATAFVVFGALALVDVAQFAIAVNAGPIIRSLYLWNILLWLLLHLMLAIAVFSDWRRGNEPGRAVNSVES